MTDFALYSIDDLAVLFRRDKQTINRWIKSKKLPVEIKVVAGNKYVVKQVFHSWFDWECETIKPEQNKAQKTAHKIANLACL